MLSSTLSGSASTSVGRSRHNVPMGSRLPKIASRCCWHAAGAVSVVRDPFETARVWEHVNLFLSSTTETCDSPSKQAVFEAFEWNTSLLGYIERRVVSHFSCA